MTCECSCSDNTIKITAGKSANITFNFSDDISSYTSARFVVRKDYSTPIILDKTISELGQKTLDVVLSPTETALFTEFLPNKDFGRYIYGLDLLDTAASIITNIFPQTGTHAPEFVVYKNATKDD